MFRGAWAAALISLLAVTLFALPVFTPGGSFASAHTSREAVAKAPSGTNPSARAQRVETVACHDTGRPGDPTGPLRVRDRHRSAAAPAPDAPERPLPRQRTQAASDPAPPCTGHRRPSRSSADRTPAALQVFRC